jgi:nitrogen fixation NifU-like protein
MSDLRELSQEVILDHYRQPRNLRALPDANRRADGYNPLCGDRVTLYARVRDGVIEDASFEGTGCAISTASASLLTETVKGKTLAEVESIFHSFHDLVTGKTPAESKGASLGKLAVFSGVSEFPVRVKCATLSWHTLRSALEGTQTVATTE